MEFISKLCVCVCVLTRVKKLFYFDKQYCTCSIDDVYFLLWCPSLFFSPCICRYIEEADNTLTGINSLSSAKHDGGDDRILPSLFPPPVAKSCTPKGAITVRWSIKRRWSPVLTTLFFYFLHFDEYLDFSISAKMRGLYLSHRWGGSAVLFCLSAPLPGERLRQKFTPQATF